MQKPTEKRNPLSVKGFIGPADWRGDPRISVPPQRSDILLRPFTTMIDWLTVMMVGPWHCVELDPDAPVAWAAENVRPGLAIFQTARSPKDWGKVFYITDSLGEKLVTICACPTDRRKFPPDFLTAQFANSTLATGEWRELLRGLVMMGCTYQGVQRIDIAADGWEDETIGGGGDYIAVVRAALCGYGNYYGKARWGTEHLGKSFNGFMFGTRASNKYLRCYRKKREMKVKGLKPHIVAAWRAALNGYDVMSDPREVGRLEIQLKGRELRRYYSGEGHWESLAELHDPKTRVGVFQSTTQTLFDFRTWPTDGRARTARKMHQWDWSLCTTNAPEEFGRAQRARHISPHRVKTAIHAVYDVYLACGDQEVLRTAVRMAHSAGPDFVDWMNRNETQWMKAFDAVRTEATIPGLSTGFTRSYLERLADQDAAALKDPLSEFNDAAQVVRYDDDDADADEFPL